jgi:hypothetical protein
MSLDLLGRLSHSLLGLQGAEDEGNTIIRGVEYCLPIDTAQHRSTWIPFAIPFSIFSVDFLHTDMAVLQGVFAGYFLAEIRQISL